MQPLYVVKKKGFRALLGPLAAPLEIKSPTTYATYLRAEYLKKGYSHQAFGNG